MWVIFGAAIGFLLGMLIFISSDVAADELRKFISSFWASDKLLNDRLEKLDKKLLDTTRRLERLGITVNNIKVKLEGLEDANQDGTAREG